MKRTKDHKLRHGRREIPQSYCAQLGCKFYGKEAQQGVCFSSLSPTADKYITAVMQTGDHLLHEMKLSRFGNKAGPVRKWVQYLESHIICTWANNTFLLDEVIALRAECATLRLAAKKAVKS